MKSFVTEESLVNSELSDSGRALVDSDATTSMRTAQPQETIGLGRIQRQFLRSQTLASPCAFPEIMFLAKEMKWNDWEFHEGPLGVLDSYG
ncbi:hypothetical protein AK812_SmicGene21180 [Symbiodinium microadriaticum]|uniref:Uncharacterized protein n=1 Tax=Symbiodinium microadriaticum TaxID=2951 RepID=A0A1Q9DN21_SYMMI|nr:hypothetical protein AK812_SmicGene48928 [Symbiodinium microadriaticum]OLP96577.1 hypothetical protein AK812_SmicGene21180 [Symbiodinium microadriaticum]